MHTFRMALQGVAAPFSPSFCSADRVILDLQRGVQLLNDPGVLHTALADLFDTYSLGQAPFHRFAGARFALATEIGGSLSSVFAHVVSLSLFQQHAGVSWIVPMGELWDSEFLTSAGNITCQKRQARSYGPDFLAASFDPADFSGDVFHAIENKGSAKAVGFSTEQFRKWLRQARNIRLRVGREPVAVKSWVSAFAYGFDADNRDSTLLLADPPSDEQGGTGALKSSWSALVRMHLARRCRLLGQYALGEAVLYGREPRQPFPAVYRVSHPQLGARRYFGAWYVRRPDGTLQPVRLPFDLSGAWLHRGGGAFEIAGGGAGTPFRIHVFFDGPGQVPPWVLEYLLGGESVFVGQDAAMIRTCLKTPLEKQLPAPLDERVMVNGDDLELLVLENGSIACAGSLVKPDPEGGEFWFRRQG